MARRVRCASAAAWNDSMSTPHGAGARLQMPLLMRAAHGRRHADDVADLRAAAAARRAAPSIPRRRRSAGRRRRRRWRRSSWPGRICGSRPPAMPKLTIAGAPVNTAWRIAAARRPTLPPQANTLTPGADAIFASARIPVMTINESPWKSRETNPLQRPRSRRERAPAPSDQRAPARLQRPQAGFTTPILRIIFP